MSLALKYPPNYTYSDYKMWKGDWEMIDGIPYAMTPSPVWRHQFSEGRILSQLVGQLDSCPDCFPFTNLDWIVSNVTVVRPDAMVVCGNIKGDFIEFPPTLIVEILSKSTSNKDRKLKFKLYEQQKVKYYLIVDVIEKIVEVYQLEKGKYTLKGKFTKESYNFDLNECRAELSFDQIWPD